MNKSEHTEISIIRKVISIVSGIAIIGFGFYFGVVPIFRITMSLLKGIQEHGYFGILVSSITMVPLGIWVIFSVLKRE